MEYLAYHSRNEFSFIVSEHHVHFDTTTLKDEFESENSVTYQKSGDNIVVHLGFLQINHRYLIELKLPATLFKCNAEPIMLVPENDGIPNIHCKLVEFSGKNTEKSEFFDVKVEYFAHKEKLLKEELKLVNSKNSEELLKLIITARVLGKGKGTPMLRNGIHCIGVQEDEESEASDFQGFGSNQN